MALEITYIKPSAPAPMVKINARLCVSQDGKRLVPDGHLDAAFLFCTPDTEVSKEAFERYELDESVGGVVASETRAEEASFPGDGESDVEAQAEPEPEEDEPKGKSRRKAEDKAVKGPDGDKGLEPEAEE